MIRFLIESFRMYAFDYFIFIELSKLSEKPNALVDTFSCFKSEEFLFSRHVSFFFNYIFQDYRYDTTQISLSYVLYIIYIT